MKSKIGDGDRGASGALLRSGAVGLKWPLDVGGREKDACKCFESRSGDVNDV